MKPKAVTPEWNVPPAGVRERVGELFGKSDLRIARTLINERFVGVKDSAIDLLNDAERAQFEDTIRRTVNNHRRKLLEGWKTEPIPKPGDKQTAHEFIARMRTRIEDLERILERSDAKSTARVGAIAEIRQLETVIAQVKNVDVAGRRLSRLLDDGGEDDVQGKLPLVGLVLDWRNVSNETKEDLLASRSGERGSAAAGRAS